MDLTCPGCNEITVSYHQQDDLAILDADILRPISAAVSTVSRLPYQRDEAKVSIPILWALLSCLLRQFDLSRHVLSGY
jgi:hypothetical protein